jgi:hypothetical protein
MDAVVVHFISEGNETSEREEKKMKESYNH